MKPEPRRFAIPLGVFLGAFVVFYNFPPVCGYTSCFLTFFFEGRWASYVPTISETGTEYPNTHVIRFVMSYIGMITVYSFLVSIYYLEFQYRIPWALKLLRWVTFTLSVVGTIGLGCFSMVTAPPQHFFFASNAFGGIFAFEVIDFLFAFKGSPAFANANRLISIMAQLAALFVLGAGKHFLSRRRQDTVTAFSEYALLSGMGWFYATFYSAYSGLDLWLCVEE